MTTWSLCWQELARALTTSHPPLSSSHRLGIGASVQETSLEIWRNISADLSGSVQWNSQLRAHHWPLCPAATELTLAEKKDGNFLPCLHLEQSVPYLNFLPQFLIYLRHNLSFSHVITKINGSIMSLLHSPFVQSQHRTLARCPISRAEHLFIISSVFPTCSS